MSQSFTIEELGKKLSAKWVKRSEQIIEGVADLAGATPSDISFFSNPKYKSQIGPSQAGLIIVPSEEDIDETHNFLIHENPSLAFQMAIELFIPKTAGWGSAGIHPSAVIDESASIEEGAFIGAHCTVGAHVKIGAGTKIYPNTTIYEGCSIGQNCLIHSNVVIREHTQIGDRVILQPGAMIGSCGFGYSFSQGAHQKLDQLGTVIIEDDVEIGANTTVDRSRFKETRIGKGSKIDNLVQIAHGVELGPHNILVGQCGIAGSTKTGAYVVIAGQAGVAGHIEITDGVTLASRASATKSIKEKGKYGGTPAVPLKAWHEQTILIKRLPSMAKELKKLKQEVLELKKGQDR